MTCIAYDGRGFAADSLRTIDRTTVIPINAKKLHRMLHGGRRFVVGLAGDRRDNVELCARCYHGRMPFKPTPDVPRWIEHQLTHESWQRWRDTHPRQVERLRAALAAAVLPKHPSTARNDHA